MNSTACHRSLQILWNGSCRHARTRASHPFPGAHGSSLFSHPFSSKTAKPYLLPAVEGLHIRKKRRYSSQAASHFRHDEKRWVERDQLGEASVKPAHGWSDAFSAARHARREDRDGQEANGGIIITSNRQNLRDKQGRPWTKDTSSTGQDAGAVGVGVGIPAAPKRKKKPRMELRDLAVKPKKKLEPWQAQKGALENKFGDEGWNPRKRLSPDAMEGIRALHEEDSERWSTPVLAEHFKVSPEAIRRILKSKWKPKDDVESQKRRERWARRHDRIWDHQAELGLRPPREKDRAVEDPETFDEELRAKEMLDIARRA